MKFWLFRDGDTEGPFTIDELEKQLEDGGLTLEDQVCAMGEKEWQPLSSILSPPLPPESVEAAPPADDASRIFEDLPAAPAARRQKVALLAIAAVVVVTGIAATFILLFDTPSRPLPKTASYVPEESALVVTAHVGDLLEKSKISDLMSKGILQEMSMPRPVRKKIEDLFENPSEYGLNMMEPVYFFMMPDPLGASYPAFVFTIPIVSRENFLDGLEDIVTIEGRPDRLLIKLIDELKKMDTVSPEDEVAFGINDEVFVVVIQDIPYSERRSREEGVLAEVAEAVLEGGKGLAAADDSFHEHQTTLFDMGAWVNLGGLMEMVPAEELEDEFGQLGDLEKLKSFQLAGGIHFGQGEITGDMAMYYDEKLLGDWGGGGLGSELLNAVPEDSIMAFSQSMDMEVVQKWFDDRPGIKGDMEEALQSELGMSLSEVLGAFGGDLVFALTGIEMVETRWGGSTPQPAILFGATIKDGDRVRKILAEPARELMKESGGPIRLVMRDDAFFFCSPKDRSGLEKNGAVSDPISGEKYNLLADNDSGLFVDSEELTKSLARTARDDEEMGFVLDSAEDLGLATLTWNTEAGAQKIWARIKMSKADKNSLEQIIDSAFSAAIAAQRRIREWEGTAGGEAHHGSDGGGQSKMSAPAENRPWDGAASNDEDQSGEDQSGSIPVQPSPKEEEAVPFKKKGL
ncbi:MAG: hypothetical protein CMO66_01190 [Verrucomicrobiales bacterium]|nr:hypothetical protein [Verrucomicrobiales bacterium]